MSLVRVDPVSHQMAAVGDPVVTLLNFTARGAAHSRLSRMFRVLKVLSSGYNSFVGAVSLPSGSETPSTFTYMQPTGAKSTAKARQCIC